MRDGYRNVSHRGYTNAILEFDDCRLPSEQILGEVHKGFEVANPGSVQRGCRSGPLASVVPNAR